MSSTEPAFTPHDYRGRLAPTPSGLLHLGHARTFFTAQQRAQAAGGTLILRVEDLDPQRCRPEFTQAMLDDLRWIGFIWQEGPDVGGPHEPYVQSERREFYLDVLRQLHQAGVIYPSPHSRKDVDLALLAPHDAIDPNTQAADAAEREPIFPASLRPAEMPTPGSARFDPGPINWRFRVPDGEAIQFDDGRHGPTCRVAGVDFGDFLVWRRDGYPSYELAVVADDHAMQINEVVRGEDLLTSTARQLLLYRTLGWSPPAFYHAPLVVDAEGRRLAKRSGATALRTLREAGQNPAELRAGW
jgi:glutamyl/glutaminyl-tRNA synthetase